MSLVFFKLILLWVLIIPNSLTGEINIKHSKPNIKSVDKFKGRLSYYLVITNNTVVKIFLF